MSNTTRYVLGGAVIAGAGYYIYEQRLQQAQQPSSRFRIPGFGSGSSKPEDGPAERTGRQIDEAALNAKDKLKDLKYDTNKQIDSGFAKLEKEQSKVSNWASDKLNSAADSLDGHAAKTQERADLLYKQAHKDDPKGLRKLGQDVKGSVVDAKNQTENRLENAKDSVVGGVTSIKDTIVGRKDDAAHEINKATDDLKDKAEDAKHQTKSWFGKVKSSAKDNEESARDSVRGWSESAQQNADAHYDAAKSKAESAKSSLFSWGSRKQSETEESVQSAYDEAQRIYNDAEARLKKSKGSIFSWNRDEAQEKIQKEAQAQYDEAQKQLNSASNKLTEWKEQAKQSLNSATGRDNGTNGGFYDWLRGGNANPTDEARVARTANASLRGWGESAEQFSQEELEDANKRAGTFSTKSKAQKNLDSWSKWADKKYDQTSQGAEDYYKDAQSAFEDAQKQLKDSSSHWYSWGSKKSKETELEAKKNVQAAEERVREATDNLSKWGIDVAKDLNKKFWSGADSTIHETKKGLNTLNDKTIGGLNQAQDWVKDQK